MRRFLTPLLLLAAPASAQNLPGVNYDNVKPFTIVNVAPSSPPEPRAQGWADPVLGLALLGVGALALAAWAFKRSSNSKGNTAGMVGIGGALLGAALFWPQFGGASIPFDVLGKVDVNAFNKIFLPTFIKAGIVAVGGYAAAWFLLPQDAPQKPETASAPEAPRRNHPLKPGDRIKTYKGYGIVKAENGVTVDGVAYAGLLAAEKAIDAMVKSEH